MDPTDRTPLPWLTASLWTASLDVVPAPVPLPDRRFEVVVVGGGLTGLLTALGLVRSGVDAVVLERHTVGGVTTRGSTGKLTALQGSKLLDVTEQRGADEAVAYAAAARDGVDALRTLVVDLDLECSLRSTTDVTFAETAQGLERCRRAYAAARDAGLPVSWIDDVGLGRPTLGGVALQDQAHLDPGALCRALADQLPGRIFEGTAVVDVDEQAGGVEVSLEGGDRLVADHVVVATLGPVHDPALLSTRCSPQQSYAVACPHPHPPASTLISTDPTSRSIRPAAIDGGPGIVVGGAGHVLGEPGDRGAEERWAELAAYAADLGAGPPVHRWSAHDLVPSDAVPFIGRAAPGAQRCWVAAGFGKWGISTAMVAARLIGSGIRSERSPFAELFDPTRLADSATVSLAKDAARSFRHAVVDRVADALPGHDDRPRCTHLGCLLSWDDAERTWDCACHGSRFGADGHVVAGPASAPLETPVPDPSRS